MILYLDTSQREIITLKLDNQEFKVESGKTKDQIVLKFINDSLKNNGKNIHDIQEIWVNTGPGSFTGLRVGVTVAITLGWALNIPVNGIDVKSGKIPEIKYSS